MVMISVMSFTLALDYDISSEAKLYKQEGISMVPKGCPDMCGNVTIYYPFGIGPNKDCYLNEQFIINCTKSSDDIWKPYLSSSRAGLVAATLSSPRPATAHLETFEFHVNFTNPAVNACNYALFVDQDWYAASFPGGRREQLVVRVVRSWTVPNLHPSDPSHYCVNGSSYWGCFCQFPKKGNPYIANGCQGVEYA
nr:wall-associated receptor kinase-like 1 [Ipomoea batatas]